MDIIHLEWKLQQRNRNSSSRLVRMRGFGSEEASIIWTNNKGPIQAGTGKNNVKWVSWTNGTKRNKPIKLQSYPETCEKWTSQTAPRKWEKNLHPQMSLKRY